MDQTPPYPALSLGAAHKMNTEAFNSVGRPSEGSQDPSINLQQHQLFLLPCFLSVEMKQQQMPRKEPLEKQKLQRTPSTPARAQGKWPHLAGRARSTWTPA